MMARPRGKGWSVAALWQFKDKRDPLLACISVGPSVCLSGMNGMGGSWHTPWSYFPDPGQSSKQDWEETAKHMRSELSLSKCFISHSSRPLWLLQTVLCLHFKHSLC